MTETSHRMIRSRSEMGRIEWIDNDDEDQFDLPLNQYNRRMGKRDIEGREDKDDEEYNHLRRRIRSSSERRHRSHNNRDIVYRNQLPEYSTPSRIIPPPPRLLPRTPTIDFSSYRSPPQCSLNHSSTCPSSLHKKSLARYHSLDHGYNSASSPSDGEHSLHRPYPSISRSKPPSLPLSGILRHSSSPSHHSIHNVFDPPSHQSISTQSYSSRPISIDNR